MASPDLTPERWQRVKSVFNQVLELNPGQRQSFIESTCSDDPVVLEQVHLLVAHHAGSSGFLEPVVEGAVMRLETSLQQRGTMFAAGAILNHRFRIVSFIGKGGMGEVYEAFDELGDVRVALKTIRSGMEIDPQLKAQFLREMQIARQITHSNVCRIHDVFDCTVEDPILGGTHQLIFLTMELLEGESLADHLARHGKMTAQEALPVIRDIVSALSAAHEQGVIHRDLKSSNVMLVPSKAGGRRAVLTDFGLARIHSPQDESMEHGIAGTPDYMAPEQLHGGLVSFPADIFALGVVAYEMVTARRPFPSSSTLTGAARRANSVADPPRAHTPGLSPRWERAILRCLELNPAGRFPRPRDFLAELDGTERRRTITRRTAIGVSVLAISGIGGLLWRTREGTARVSSLAVLPFQSLAGDTDTEYFADGLTGELIQMLSRMPGLRVVARTSSAQFKGSRDLKAVGSRLKVQAILTGAMRKQGGRVTVTAQLTNLNDGQWLWSGSFNEELRMAPRVRVNLAMAIAAAIQPRLPEVQLAGMGGPETSNEEAYRLYLLGKHHASYRTEEGLKLSVDYLEQSIAADPNFALSHAELAETCNMLAGNPGWPPEVYFPRAEAEAQRAIALDPHLGEAHISLGLSYQRYRWDWPAADREFRDAIRLSGGLALAHHRYAGFLSNLGRHAEALQEIQVAGNLDPLSAPIQNAHAVFLFRARRYDEALGRLQATVNMFPGFAQALPEMAEIYEAKGMWRQAIETYQKADELSRSGHFNAGGLAHALACAGRTDEARTILRDLETGFGARNYSAAEIAHVYAGLADWDKTFYWFDIAADRREPAMMTVKVDPANDPLRGDPRFSRLLDRLRL